VEFCVL